MSGTPGAGSRSASPSRTPPAASTSASVTRPAVWNLVPAWWRPRWSRPRATCDSARRSVSRPRTRRWSSRPAASGRARAVREHVTPRRTRFLRAAPGSTGDGLRVGLETGAATERRAGPGLRPRDGAARAGREEDFVRLSQLYARRGRRRRSAESLRDGAPGPRSTWRSGARASPARAPGTGCGARRSGSACAIARWGDGRGGRGGGCARPARALTM